MKQELRKAIGLRMREIRKSLGYTQIRMVSFLDIGRANFSRIEKGEIFPTASILNALRKKFNISLDWLIANEGEMFSRKNQKKRALLDGNFGKYTEEVNELLFHMEKVPLVRHAILGFFLEFRMKNQEIIHSSLEEKPARGSGKGS